MGPMTGRGAGFCAGFSVPGYANPVAGGRGAYGGFGNAGRGRGMRNQYYATGLTGWQRAGVPMNVPYPQYQMAPEENLQVLKNQVKFMKEDLERTQALINEMESTQEASNK